MKHTGGNGGARQPDDRQPRALGKKKDPHALSPDPGEAGEPVDPEPNAMPPLLPLPDLPPHVTVHRLPEALPDVPSLPRERLTEILGRMRSGYYRRPEVIDTVAERLAVAMRKRRAK